MKKIAFPIDLATNQETRRHGNSDMPIGVYHHHLSSYEAGYTPWHWHKEVELYFVLEGTVRLNTTAGEFILNETEGCFINSNCLHSMHPHNCSDVIFQSLVFDPFIISSSISLLFDEKYLFPLLKSKNIPSILLDSSCPYHSTIFEKVSHIVFLHKKQEFGYEIVTRNYLSEIWLNLISLARNEIENAPSSADLDYLRIHAMLSYIHENYMHEITSESIADAASLSVSECCRCFKRCLKQTPFEYVIEYRVHRAAELLLETDHSVSDICMNTGFNSSSYFSSKFKAVTGMSPREYRTSKKV